MSTKEFIISKGGAIPSFLTPLLTEIYGEAKLSELATSGIRLRFSFYSPWPKEKKKTKAKVDEATLPRLHALTHQPEVLEREIEQFSARQLLQIAGMAGIHLSKGTKVTSLRAQLSNSLRSEAVWRGISGGAANPQDTKSEQTP